MSPTRYCQRWPQNPSNRCELFDVQQPAELTVEPLTTQSGRMLVTFDRTVPVPTSSAENRIGYAQNLVGRASGMLLTEGDDGARTGAAPAVPRWLCPASCDAPAVPRWLCRAGCTVPAVPHRLCRAGCTPPAVPRQLGVPLRCSRRCCRSYPPSSLPLCALHRRQTCHCLHHTDDRARHHKCCGLLTELRRISL